MPSASAVAPSTQVTNPEIPVSDKTAEWFEKYERYNDHCAYRKELQWIFDESPGLLFVHRDTIMGIYDQLLPLEGNEHIFEMFVKSVWNWSDKYQWNWSDKYQ